MSVALVTGGSRGIGAGIVRALMDQGCTVASVHFGDAPHPDASLNIESNVASYSGAEEAVARVIQTLGDLDSLVCCAGITSDRASWKMTEEQWDSVLDVNLKGCFNYCRAVAPHFRGRGAGRIVNIASINGLRGKFGQANYAASKGGMIALTKTLARELGPKGVTVNAVAPGFIATEMTRDLPEEFVQAARSESLLGKLGAVEDVANLVAFLCSDRAGHITGQCISVDGGQYL